MESHKPHNDLPLLPPRAQIETPDILRQTVRSARALANLRGFMTHVPNPRLLVNSIVLQEARLSSEIESIVTTNDDLYRAVANVDKVIDPGVKEVLGYREAVWLGFDLIKHRPLGTHIAVEMVRTLRRIEVDIRNTPGTTLTDSQDRIIYTPPQGERLIRDLLSNLETFIHDDSDGLDPLIRMAVMHYQFEAIHPFTDGNGRTGRILNVLYLVQKGLLDLPILYLSDFILTHKSDYYRLLRDVTESGNWSEWILFMLQAVEVTANRTTDLAKSICDAMDKASETIRKSEKHIYSRELVEILFSNPYCKIQFLVDAGLAQRQTAANYLKKISALGISKPIKIGREVYYLNHALVQLLRHRE